MENGRGGNANEADGHLAKDALLETPAGPLTPGLATEIPVSYPAEKKHVSLHRKHGAQEPEQHMALEPESAKRLAEQQAEVFKGAPVRLLHGTMRIKVERAKSLPNLDLFSHHVASAFRCCVRPVTDRGHHVKVSSAGKLPVAGSCEPSTVARLSIWTTKACLSTCATHSPKMFNNFLSVKATHFCFCHDLE